MIYNTKRPKRIEGKVGRDNADVGKLNTSSPERQITVVAGISQSGVITGLPQNTAQVISQKIC